MAKTKVDIISGFLGAGKTSFIKKLLEEAISEEKVVLIENEFGEIGIDGGFLKDAGIEIREMNSGCICCSLVGDFASSLKEILTKYAPDRVIIEPSGVGKLSDVMQAVVDVESELSVESNSAVTVVDVKKCRLYMKNFGEFFNNQVQFASTIVLSRTDVAEQKVIDQAVERIRSVNPGATIITTPVSLLSGEKLLEILEQPVDLKAELLKQIAEEGHEHHHDHEEGHEHHHHDHEEGHEHHHHDHEEGHEHHHHDHEEGHEHHHHDDHEEGHEHHHHDHEEEHAHHEHHHDGACSCGCHHHHGHDADEIFDSWGLEQLPPMSREKLSAVLDQLADSEDYGVVVRCKGMVSSEDPKTWYYFDLVPGETEIREGAPDYTGKVCVIGTGLRTDALEKEFRI